MTASYKYLENLASEIVPPVDGTLSRTLYQDGHLKAVLFGFGPGQELSEHTASTPAILHFISGEAEVTLGDDRMGVAAGTWLHMAAKLPHSIRAKTSVVMLLLLLKGAAA
jgi:quercetin dioxygenase-like cupin family protein